MFALEVSLSVSFDTWNMTHDQQGSTGEDLLQHLKDGSELPQCAHFLRAEDVSIITGFISHARVCDRQK